VHTKPFISDRQVNRSIDVIESDSE